MSKEPTKDDLVEQIKAEQTKVRELEAELRAMKCLVTKHEEEIEYLSKENSRLHPYRMFESLTKRLMLEQGWTEEQTEIVLDAIIGE